MFSIFRRIFPGLFPKPEPVKTVGRGKSGGTSSTGGGETSPPEGTKNPSTGTSNPPPVKPPEIPVVQPPPITPIQPNKTMKTCPKTGETMQEIVFNGEKIDVSSAGYYFYRGELTRILGKQPSFLASLRDRLLSVPDPLSQIDKLPKISEITQKIAYKREELKNYRQPSLEFEKAYSELKDLEKRLAELS